MRLLTAAYRTGMRGLDEGSTSRWRWSVLGTVLLVSACADGVVGPLEGFTVAPLDSTFVFEYPDFASDPERPAEPPGPGHVTDSLVYEARVTAVDTSISSDPMSLWITAAAHNPTSDTVELAVQACAVRVEAHREPARSGAPVRVRTPDVCALLEPYSVVLPPGATAESGGLLGEAHLSESFPADGRYYFTVRLLLQGDTITLPAGSADVRLRVPGLAYHVRLNQVSSHSARVEVGVTNRNDGPVRLTMGPCAPEMRLYRDEARTELVRRWYGRGKACPGVLLIRDVEAGASIRPPRARTLSVSQLIRPGGFDQGGIDRGLYHLSVVLGHNWRPYEFPAGPIYIW